MSGPFSRVPEEPAPTRWRLPSPNEADRHGLVGVGADLEPGTLLDAYRSGLFPMPMRKRLIGWWSPDPRGILPLDGLKVSRSLRRSCTRFEVRFDTAFEAVMRACADPSRPHGWINEEFITAYTRLHRMGWAHSVETWLDGELVGGLYGVRIRRFFAGESMFHTATDASKVALVALVQEMRSAGMELLDVQWRTDHLATLGVVDIDRLDYLRRLQRAVA
ncbi:MAG TPA: leucyl/phenylalanyl-tRNA--protein transferase [Acidimicrobiaceae bacterium]|nr:leucyl/phenylalanyl-tRNA--protein transferase [Acidimicrobiaceae bacterium]